MHGFTCGGDEQLKDLKTKKKTRLCDFREKTTRGSCRCSPQNSERKENVVWANRLESIIDEGTSILLHIKSGVCQPKTSGEHFQKDLNKENSYN